MGTAPWLHLWQGSRLKKPDLEVNPLMKTPKNVAGSWLAFPSEKYESQLSQLG